MREVSGINIIQSLRKKWITNSVIAIVFISAGCAFVAGILLYKFLSVQLWLILPLFVVLCAALLFAKRPWQITNTVVTSFLNTNYSELEESCGLLLKPVNGLSLLETLQAERTFAALLQITSPKQFTRPLRTSSITLLLLCAVGAALAVVPVHFNHSSNNNNKSITNNTTAEKIPQGIQSVKVTIVPPAYTKHAQRQQNQFNLKVEEGSTISWEVESGETQKNIRLLFNDSTTQQLHYTNNQSKACRAVKTITSSGFYQVMVDGKLSEFYRIEMIKDQPPVITITSPKPNITIEYGEPQRININAVVADDYGVKNASVVATIASGSGEAVKFKEQNITFATSFNGQLAQYQLQKMVDLAALGMQPADELYFYIKATDNNNQEKRSDMYIVTLADTAQLMESDVLLGNVKLKPEFFRSERQIIIETEQLLKDKDTLRVEDFKNRSNNLGIDQKLLRLRYGKFLGEENESNEGGDVEAGDLNDPKNFGKASAILDAFSDKHDNAEDATFFTDDIKQQLKATLTEMWGAEMRLRTFKPQDALPYEYKALRLLKDLQQKSRVYVAKTTSKTTPLKPEKRLTGDLSKIIEPQTQTTIPQATGVNQTVAASLSALEELKVVPHITVNDMQVLQQALQVISNKAAAEPAVYLQGLQSLKKILETLQGGGKASLTDIQTAENALQKIIAAPGQLPQKTVAQPYNQLQQQYFKNLQKANN